jgi:hypothetical protein
VTESNPISLDLPLSHPAPQEKATRSESFGEVASHYERYRVIAEARRLLRELLDVEGEATVDVAFRSHAWRSRHHG